MPRGGLGSSRARCPSPDGARRRCGCAPPQDQGSDAADDRRRRLGRERPRRCATPRRGCTGSPSEYRGPPARHRGRRPRARLPERLHQALGDARGDLARSSRRSARALLGVGRFVVRAWISSLMIGYARSSSRSSSPSRFARGLERSRRRAASASGLLGGLLRAIARRACSGRSTRSRRVVRRRQRTTTGSRGVRAASARRDPNEVPFYEKVNRFVFGPRRRLPDPHAMRARILAEIRAQKGRIGLADVMRVTGLPRDEADPLMARLMLDHDGTVEVAEQGGIVYRFEGLRRTDGAAGSRRPSPTRAARRVGHARRRCRRSPATSGGANRASRCSTASTSLASGWVLAHGLTLSNLFTLLTYTRGAASRRSCCPHDGAPIALGVVPLVFSLALFALPMARAVRACRAEKKVAQENARLASCARCSCARRRRSPSPTRRCASRIASPPASTPRSKEITRARRRSRRRRRRRARRRGALSLRRPRGRGRGPRGRARPCARRRSEARSRRIRERRRESARAVPTKRASVDRRARKATCSRSLASNGPRAAAEAASRASCSCWSPTACRRCSLLRRDDDDHAIVRRWQSPRGPRREAMTLEPRRTSGQRNVR